MPPPYRSGRTNDSNFLQDNDRDFDISMRNLNYDDDQDFKLFIFEIMRLILKKRKEFDKFLFYLIFIVS